MSKTKNLLAFKQISRVKVADDNESLLFYTNWDSKPSHRLRVDADYEYPQSDVFQSIIKVIELNSKLTHIEFKYMENFLDAVGMLNFYTLKAI